MPGKKPAESQGMSWDCPPGLPHWHPATPEVSVPGVDGGRLCGQMGTSRVGLVGSSTQ